MAHGIKKSMFFLKILHKKWFVSIPSSNFPKNVHISRNMLPHILKTHSLMEDGTYYQGVYITT